MPERRSMKAVALQFNSPSARTGQPSPIKPPVEEEAFIQKYLSLAGAAMKPRPNRRVTKPPKTLQKRNRVRKELPLSILRSRPVFTCKRLHDCHLAATWKWSLICTNSTPVAGCKDIRQAGVEQPSVSCLKVYAV